MKSWKSKEKWLTEYLSQGLLPAERKSRYFMGESVEDVSWGPFSIEMKTRKTVPPQYALDWMSQAKDNAKGKIPVVVMHRDREQHGQQIVMLRLRDFWALVQTLIVVSSISGKDELALPEALKLIVGIYKNWKEKYEST